MPVWLIAFVIVFLLGTLVEYWGHRMMHAFLMKAKHAEHHRDGWGQGWFWEFVDYFLGTIYILPLGFLYPGEDRIEAGIGWAAGGLCYAMFAAYAHQLQHEKPELCFWLVRPVHFIHHDRHMWHNNFGISFDIWDRVFGTYKKVEWQPDAERRWSLRGYFTIKWI